MLHLHRFERQQALSLGNLFPLRNLHRRHPPRHRRLDLAVVDAVRITCAAGTVGLDRERRALLSDEVSPWCTERLWSDDRPATVFERYGIYFDLCRRTIYD